MRAQTLHAVVVENLPRLLAVGETLELAIRRIAEFDDLDPDRLHVFQQSSEVPLHDPVAMRVRLTADREAKRVRVRGPAGCDGEEPGDSGVSRGLLEELSPRHGIHTALLYGW